MGKLIERERELQTLQEAWKAAASGRGRVVALTGPTGVGKTALAEAAADLAAGDSVVWGRSWRGQEPEPYWPWRQILRQVVRRLGPQEAVAEMGPDAASIGYLVPEVAEVLAAGGLNDLPPPRPAHLYDAVLTWLCDVAVQRPLMLVLDGIETADDGTLAAIEFFTREARDSRVMVMCTADEEASARPPRLSETISGIRRDGTVVDLGGLSEEGTRLLYELTAGTPAAPPVLAAIHRASGGNPLFVQEIARQFSTTGELHRPDRSMGLRVPRGMKEVLLRRIEDLGPSERRVVEAAAVVGAEFEADVLAAVVADAGDVFTTLSSLVDRRILEEASALGRYRFRHVLMRDALYEEQTLAERRSLHARIGAVRC